MKNYKICNRCVMDTSDPLIRFDADGYCNHCSDFLRVAPQYWFPNAEGERKLHETIEKIKESGKGNRYDCMIGLSGGVDSSYLAYKMKEYGLRPLIFHIDAGWNSPLAVDNIKLICEKLGYDLHTHTVDWEEMKDLQRAFLASAVANQDVPQDHIFFAVLFKMAEKNNIKYWLSGSNYATESILPQAWGYNGMDSRHLKGIHKRFGTRPLKSYIALSFREYCYYFLGLPKPADVQSFAPLNLMPYNVTEAKKELVEHLGWHDYGKKHYESKFTKLFQGYYLPTKFGYDKRRAHLSSLVISETITRDAALAELEKPLYQPDELQEDLSFVLTKLGLTHAEWDALMALPNKSYKDYPHFEDWIRLAYKWHGARRRLAAKFPRVHSLVKKITGA